MVNDISHSKYTNNIRKSLQLPPLAGMRTKGQCKLSEKELITKIKDLARRDAAAGKNSLHDDCKAGSEYRRLYNDFLSFASPDRAGIIQNKLSQLSGGTATISLKNGRHSEAFEVLFAMIRSGRKHDPDVGTNFISFKDSQGIEVAHYGTTVGWSFPPTSAEIARSTAFHAIWDQALADAQKESESEGKEGIIFQARA